MYLINWPRELKRLYSTVLPTSDIDISEVLSLFSGYEEALWLSLCGRFGVDPETLVMSPEDSKTQELQLRFRFMRFYSRYCPSKLSEVDGVVALAAKSGEQHVLNRLAVKYGPEPRGELTIRERVNMWFAYYGELERIDGADKLVSAFDGHEAALCSRLEVDLGPEPTADMCVDPREPRLRLSRIFSFYDPDLLPKLDYFLVKNAGNFLRCFALLQRRYGREPQLMDMKQLATHREALRDRVDASVNIVKLMQEAETEAKRREQIAATASTIVEFASTAHLITLRPVSFQRHNTIATVRRMVVENDNYTEPQILSVTIAVFQAYQRLLVPAAHALVARRFGPVKEAIDWLCYLDYLYANHEPYDNARTLRQIASLLDIQYGDRLGEIAAAGGVEAFVNGLAPASHKDWIKYLVAAHGMPDEHAIGIRNRRVNHFLFYNPGKTVRDAEAFIQKAQRLYPIVEEALTVSFGEEPPAPAVHLDRVQRILERYAPQRVANIDDVIEAHCLPRDKPEDVFRRICRTYGLELPKTFERLELVVSEECEQRFLTFVSEMRMREILARRFAAAIDSASDIYNMIEQRAAREASMKLEMQLQRIRKQQEDIQSMRHAEQAGEAMQNNLANQEIFKEEELSRFRLVEEEVEEYGDIEGTYTSVFDLWDESLNVELAELLRRRRLEDDWAAGIQPVREVMELEHRELSAFLAHREIWRRKWLQDERERDRKIEEMIVLRRATEEAAAQQLEDALLVSTAFSDAREHELLMKERFAFLNQQAMHVLEYNAQLQRKRAEVRADRSRIASSIVGHRGLHANCRFADPNYQVEIKPKTFQSQTAIDDDDLDRVIPDRQELFIVQVGEYLGELFAKYEPARLGTERDLLQQYRGKEAQLVLGLEQKYNVHRWLETQTKERLETYLRKMAPHLKDDADTILRRFAGQEEAMWKYLTQVYGPPPQLQSSEMRLYLKNRLVKYLRVNAPHLLLDADIMVDQCDDNGDTLFAKLSAEYGPESVDTSRDLLDRKLRSFYKRRHLHRSVASASVLAARFVGREKLLGDLMMEKFGDNFQKEMPDADEMLL